jgi:hypothetical protein
LRQRRGDAADDAGAPRLQLVGSPSRRHGGVAMIGRLRGTLVGKRPPWALVEVGGVGYELEVPMSTLYDLPEVGSEVVLLTHYAHK